MNEIERLRQAIKALHGCDSSHLQKIPVLETFEGHVRWDAAVEEFVLVGHAKAKKAYAWCYRDKSGEPKYVVVLAIPPVTTAHDAVRTYMGFDIPKRQE